MRPLANKLGNIKANCNFCIEFEGNWAQPSVTQKMGKTVTFVKWAKGSKAGSVKKKEKKIEKKSKKKP